MKGEKGKGARGGEKQGGEGGEGLRREFFVCGADTSTVFILFLITQKKQHKLAVTLFDTPAFQSSFSWHNRAKQHLSFLN